MASSAANRAASLCARLRPWQLVISFAVKTLRRYRLPTSPRVVLDLLNGHDIASDADTVPVNPARRR